MSTIYADNIQPNLGSGVSIPGHVVQVVNTVGSGIIYFGNSTSAYTTLMTAQITPMYSDSKIVISWAQSFNKSQSSAASTLRLRRGSTTISSCEHSFNPGRMTASNVATDTPNTTSPISYVLEGIAGGGATDAQLYTVNNPTGGGLVIMEIAQ